MPASDLPSDLPTEIKGDGSRFDRQKARRAAGDPKRPGERCGATPASYLPEINRNRCEGKAECIVVCPYDVFEVRRIDAADARGLSLLGRLKSAVHGGKTAYAIRAEDCRACGLCVVACPEKAITLVHVP